MAGEPCGAAGSGGRRYMAADAPERSGDACPGPLRCAVGAVRSPDQMTPWASIASATRSKPAMFAPVT